MDTGRHATGEVHTADEHRWSMWMARAQSGDKGCYEQLLTELGAVIEAYIRARFGAIEPLEDCVQECLVTIHQARHTYDPERPFRPWLFTLVRHRTIDILRQRVHWMSIERAGPERHDDSASHEHLPRLIDGIRALDQLSPDYREAVALAKYAGYTTAEAADWLGISESALKARLQRGLAALHALLDKEDRHP